MYNSSSSRWKTSRRGHLKEKGMTGTIIFKWIPEKQVVKSRTGKWKRTGHQTLVSYLGSYATTKIDIGATNLTPIRHQIYDMQIFTKGTIRY
jgi:hypothetical protein